MRMYRLPSSANLSWKTWSAPASIQWVVNINVNFLSVIEMSWRLNAPRDFCIAIKSTPEKLGPGRYNVETSIGNTRPMKAPFNIRAGPPRDPLSGNPGPGEYNPSLPSQWQPYSSVFHSKSKREIYNLNTSVPAPTAHSQINDWTPSAPPIAPKHTIIDSRRPSGYVGQASVVGYTQSSDGSWLPVREAERGPEMIGPGSYDPILHERENSVSLGMDASRNVFRGDPTNPGPGAYEIVEKDTRLPIAISNRIASRPSSSVRKIYTGQRVWTSLAAETNACFKNHGPRKLFGKPADTPAPCDYNPELPKSRIDGDRSSFGVRAERKWLEQPKDTPGPGAYDIPDYVWVRRSNSTIPKAVDVTKVANVPGPGAYDPELPSRGGKANAVFMSQVSRLGSGATDPPGPGQYSPKIIDDAGKVHQKIHNSRFEKVGDWIEMSKIQTPSPDTYQKLEDGHGHGRTIAKAKRGELFEKNKNPGPGTYEVKHNTFFRKSHNSSIPPMPLD